MLGLPEYGEQQIEIMLGGPERAEFYEKAQPWLSDHTVGEIVELSQAMRIPASPVNDGATVLDCPQYLEREFFVAAGGADWSFRRPGAPFRLSKTPALPRPARTSYGFSTVRRDELIGVRRRGDGSIEAFRRHQSA